ncbi:MAG: DUF4317 domain-containing protein [Lachnospiraceae bacterium]|nr:DUF4317 domain-containing protein [Lachnospiraceae bacterium]
MNRKEISEIRGQFKKDGNAIDCICGCYVDNEKNIRMKERRTFLTLSEDEIFKYYEIFKKAMSGPIGKNLHNLDYTIDQELTGEGHKLLLALRDCKLKDDELLDRFYQKVVDNYEYGENYYIVLIHANYDVPGRGTDEIEMDDASEIVYEYILCCVCPVVLSEPGLCYNAVSNSIEERERDWWVELPMNGFLFPAFNDRNADVHSLLYYSKKPEELHSEWIDGCIGGPTPMSFKCQKETFQDILSETLGDDSEYMVVRQVHEELAEMIAEHKEEPEPFQLNKTQVRGILERSGVEPERMEQFDHVYEQIAGEQTTFLASNVVSGKKIDIKTADIKIQVDPMCIDMITTQMIDGRKCLVIPVEENVEVNGLKATVGFAGTLDQ